MNETKTCRTCGAGFSRPAKYSNAQWEQRVFCCSACRVPWNKGLTRADDPRIEKDAQRVAAWAKGRVGWSRGHTKATHPGLALAGQKSAAARKGQEINDAQRAALDAGRAWKRGLKKGDHPSIAAAAEKLSTRLRGRRNPEHGERMKRLYAAHPSRHPNAAVGRKSKGKGLTAPERAVAAILDGLGVEYRFNQPVGAKWPDFTVPASNAVIEADGRRWHDHPEPESRRDAYLIARGWRVLHLTDDLLAADPAACRTIVAEFLGVSA